jgi:predicted MFS family arabinose efflux permease
MRTGLIFLLLGYVLSQFYRAFLAVLSPFLAQDLGAGPDDLARASGLWFLAFGLAQLPVGWALDRLGPRRTTMWFLGLGGGGGAAIFAVAQSAFAIDAAMVMIGFGCAPVLMAAYYIFARTYSAAVFGTLAGATIGIGSLGNLASALPLALAVEAFGWRETLWALSVITLLSALSVGRFVQDPPAALRCDGEQGSLMDLLRMPALWLMVPMLAVNYAPAAGLRGLWIGPYYAQMYGATASNIGQITLLMALAMVIGNFAYGPLDRLLGTRKWVVMAGNTAGMVCLFLLWAFPVPGYWTAAMLFAAIGLFGASFPMLIAHGRSFMPPHLVGRGVSLLNFFAIGGVGLLQLASGHVHAMATPPPVTAPFAGLFLLFALALAVGLAVYAFTEDRTD